MSDQSPNLKDVEMAIYDYELPTARIAKWPAEKRHDSKLLVYNNGKILTDIYLNIATHLPENTLLVFNNTKVIAARLQFKKSTGTNIEIFLLEPTDGIDHASALSHKKRSVWKCLVGGMKKWKNDEVLEQHLSVNLSTKLYAKMIDRKSEYCYIEFTWENSDMNFSQMISDTGLIPLPPYIKRETTISDREHYQTVYAKTEGSVAAPTAGLHFTEDIFQSLEIKNINHEFITLHVGAGTFKPVTSDNIAHHDMHEEYFEVTRSTIDALCENDKFIIPVGTTSMRTLESLYWIGVKIILNETTINDNICLGQWEHLELAKHKLVSLKESMRAIKEWIKTSNQESIFGTTSICITPGYQFKISKALVTNFHQPQSTLLLLISAIMGEDWKRVYSFALNNDFRFLSFGDGSLLFIQQ
jgi:S-adenosylmethionine:tRNA ribosyltransferase-isomerase